MKTRAIELLLDSNRGIYIPQCFANEMDLNKFTGIDPEDIKTLRNGPDDEWYWEAWQSVLNNADYEENGHHWYLYQDGDLWAFCPKLMTDEEKANWDIE